MLSFQKSPSKRFLVAQCVSRISKSSSINHHFFQAPFILRKTLDNLPKIAVTLAANRLFFGGTTSLPIFFCGNSVVENFFRVDFFFRWIVWRNLEDDSFHRKMTDILEEVYMKFKSNVKQTGLRGIGISISPVDRFFKSLDFRG